MRGAWPVIEPTTPLSWGFHLDALCEHLEAITRGLVANLIVSVPPGSSKSSVCAVLWPAWCWLSDPGARFVTASYALGLATRDAVRSRRVIESPWYRERWGHAFRMTSDQNAKERYENDHTGYRVVTHVGGGATGERGRFTLIDDAHSVTEAESQAERRRALTWHDESFFNRVNDPELGGRVVVGQRVHHQDLIGHLLAKGGWTHLRIPEQFEAASPCRTPLPWRDPRTEEGQLMRPRRFGPAQVEEAKRTLGPYAWASQHQQRPVPREGGLFKLEDFGRLAPAPPPGCSWVRAWDKGFSARGDYTAGVLMARAPWGHYFVVDVARGRWDPRKRNEVIRQAAEQDCARARQPVRQVVEMEPGAGVEVTRNLLAELAPYPCEAKAPRGQKEDRAEGLSSQLAAGNVFLCPGDWHHDFVTQLALFPNADNDDMVDAASCAFTWLARPRQGAPAGGGQQRPVIVPGKPGPPPPVVGSIEYMAMHGMLRGVPRRLLSDGGILRRLGP